MDRTLRQKHDALREYLAELGSVAVSFSGGVDSTFLLKTAHDVLGDKVIAVTAKSVAFPERELEQAADFCDSEGIIHILCELREFEIEGFSRNPVNRCYLCKGELLKRCRAVADEHGISHVAEGSNTDDDGDYRPGLLAVADQGVKSPLRHCGLDKSEIRRLSREAGLRTWDKPSLACLFSRFPYGEELTEERVRMVDRAELYLLDLGLAQFRVRFHGDIARIETDESGFEALTQPNNRARVHDAFREIGFAYVALDLRGYRTGSMNEPIGRASRSD